MSEEFKTNVAIKVCKGNYAWCGNNYDGERSGHYLTDNPKIEENVMVIIDINMDTNLYEQIDLIEIYNKGGFCAKYTHHTLQQSEQLFFGLKYDAKEGGEYKICYKKILPRTDNRTLSRPPMKIIYSETIKIPFVHSHNSDCAICLELVVDNKYVSTCQHMFHINCLFDYAEQNNFTKPIADHCKLFNCEHGKKLIPFPCPICRCVLENNF
uniref:RING-type domain-containing protein n=1 Tax=viral metagenome TaxID=1070528 RepID=A0A6C0C8T1_9ZZZZ